MGIVESARGVLWARKRQPEQIAYLAALAHERFTPPELVEQAKAAEAAGFDGICCSDHLAPWWAPGEPAPAQSGNAWVWLGAAAMVTREASLGPAVTAITHRYNPVVVAQQIATLETLAPGRAFLGVGSGEAMNEVPAGMEWPSPGENLRRLEEALTIIKACSTARRSPSTASSSAPATPASTPFQTDARPSTSRPSAPKRPNWRDASRTASGAWPTRGPRRL
jgi:coenzyme F420-dependent glucose-6-phosphate dehydrogenase